MDVAIVTGSAGLIGSEAARFFADQGLRVVGIDNDMRSTFFGDDASTAWNRSRLQSDVRGYRHVDADIRDADAMEAVFRRHAGSIATVIHAAAQPSHDWAAREPITDFTVNANGTLVLLEMTRRIRPERVVHLHEHQQGLRRHAEPAAAGGAGDALGVRRVAPLCRAWHRREHEHRHHDAQPVRRVQGGGRLMVQEYGRYFGMQTACFRGGCLTGPAHSGAPLHGFLS